MANKDCKNGITIPAIEEGTVIDHIPSRQTFRIIRIIDPQEFEHVINVALNLESRKMGKKGIVKISNRILTKDEVDKIALLAPEATVSIIKDYKVAEKTTVRVPEKVERIVKCPNTNCITNHEKVDTKFTVEEKEPLKMRCVYCERTMGREDIKLQ
ncbi:MAG: aspartate carbamoyltransferase regulatory subunit [Candidatus Altiarchaeota archaeon]